MSSENHRFHCGDIGVPVSKIREEGDRRHLHGCDAILMEARGGVNLDGFSANMWACGSMLKQVPMVESSFVNRSVTDWTTRPISVFRALATGFDRVAGKPQLILPSLLLDVFLWFGPHLTIPGLIEMLTGGLVAPIGADPALVEQANLIQETMGVFVERFNLFSAFSTLPAGMPFNILFSVFSSLLVGLPSLMAMRMPMTSPLGEARILSLSSTELIFFTWLAISIIGIGAGVFYTRWLIKQVEPGAELGSVWVAWGRLLVLGFIGYVSGSLVLFLTGLVASGEGLVYLGLPLLFVAGVYLAFAPHAILRYRMGVWGALKQSLWFVRWNFIGAFGYIVLAFIVLWVSTAQVWSLPNEESWFNVLAILGHAFVSATILAGSYAFFQGRRQWLLARLDELGKRMSQNKADPTDPDGDVDAVNENG